MEEISHFWNGKHNEGVVFSYLDPRTLKFTSVQTTKCENSPIPLYMEVKS